MGKSTTNKEWSDEEVQKKVALYSEHPEGGTLNRLPDSIAQAMIDSYRSTPTQPINLNIFYFTPNQTITFFSNTQPQLVSQAPQDNVLSDDARFRVRDSSPSNKEWSDEAVEAKMREYYQRGIKF